MKNLTHSQLIEKVELLLISCKDNKKKLQGMKIEPNSRGKISASDVIFNKVIDICCIDTCDRILELFEDAN